MMAREVAVTVTVLFSLLALALARAPLDQPENGFSVEFSQDLTELPEFDPKSKSTILLPSEKPDSETPTAVEIEPEIEADEKKVPEIESLSESAIESEETVKPETETKTEAQTVPLTVVSFRPINRHFPRHPMFPMRRGHKCRHHHHRFISREFMRPWSSRFNGHTEFSFGKDMIVSGGEDQGLNPDSRGAVRQIPARWDRFHHDGPRFPRGGLRFPYGNEMEKRGEEMGRPHHHHHDHHHNHHHHHMEEDEEEERHGHEGGFMMKIRKFLNHHF